MKEKVEALGVMVAEGYGADELVFEGDRVAGVRLVDQGRKPDGSEGPGVHAGRRDPREGDDPRRRHARLAHEGARPPA